MQNLSVATLRPDQRNVNLVLLVGTILVTLERSVTVPGCPRTRVAEVVVGDESGCITMTAKNGACTHNFTLITRH